MEKRRFLNASIDKKADDILGFAKKGDYGTLVLGRRGISMRKEFLMGSVRVKYFSGPRV